MVRYGFQHTRKRYEILLFYQLFSYIYVIRPLNRMETPAYSIKHLRVIRINEGQALDFIDDIAVEEPLEIRVSYGMNEKKSISVTMRTPGNDAELAAGFLFTEGIIWQREHISAVSHSDSDCSRNAENEITVELAEDFTPQLMNAERNFYTTSSCGVCGKGSIQSIRTVSLFQHRERKALSADATWLCRLPQVLRSAQNNFSTTGGIHASGIFDLNGELLALREDVGRHNALDKLIGYALLEGWLPLDDKILVLSGRASFELIQKAAMAGITFVAAIGAPSSLAVDLAREFDMSLIGFLKESRFNIYHQGERHRIEF